MSHSITSRRGTTRRRRRARRIGSPPVRRLRAQRPPHVDALPVARPARSGACAAAAWRAAGATSAGRAARARAARARRSSGSASRSSSLAIASGTSTSAPSPVVAPARRRRSTTPSRASRVRGLAGRRLCSTPAARRPRRRPCTSSGSNGLAAVALAEDREEDRVEGLDLRRIGHEHRARRPVQPPAADRPHERERPREVGRARGRDRHAGLVQAPAERAGERRQVELDRLDAERRAGDAGVSHRCARAPRGRRRGRPPGPRRTSAPSRACDPPPRRPGARRRAG